MLHFGTSKSQLALQSKYDLNGNHTRQLSQISFNQNQLHDQKRHYPEIQSQNIGNKVQNENQQHNQEHKKQLIKLMTLVKLQSFGYNLNLVIKMVETEIAKLNFLQNMPAKQLDQQAQTIADNVVWQLLGEGGVRRLERINSLMERINIIQNTNQQEVFQSHQHEIANNDHIHDVQFNRPKPQILCSICYLLTSRYCSQKCMHSFCEDCMKGYLKQNIASGNYIINCPQYDCREQVSLQNIQYLLEKREFQKYKYFRQKNQRQLDPNNKFCNKPDCGELLKRTKDMLQCEKCHQNYCQICLQKYHEGINCDVVLKNAIEHTFNLFKIKKCPKCKSPIQKSEGCNHMNCKKCKHQFCWLCLGTYSRHHYRYYNCFGCPGMQFQDQNQLIFQRCKQITLYFMVPFILSLILFCYLCAIPIFMIGCLIYKPCNWIGHHNQFFERDIVEHVFCCFGECGEYMILWILLQPRAILYAVFIAPAKLTVMFCGEVCRIFE